MRNLVIPVFFNGDLIALKISGHEVPIRRKIPSNEFNPETIKALCLVAELIDFDSIFGPKKREEWKKGELKEFFNSMVDNQRILIKILAEKREIERGKLIKEMNEIKVFNNTYYKNISPDILAGSSAALTRKMNRMNKELLFKINKDGTYSFERKYLNTILEIIKDYKPEKL